MTRPLRNRGFTLLELMAVIAIIAILATLALPSLRSGHVRGQIVEAAKLADIAKGPIGAAWSARRELPVDNASIGLPAPDQVMATYVSSMSVENGAIHLRLGNKADGQIHGRTLTLRPAVVADAPVVPVSWVCGHASAPGKMTLRGVDRTDVPAGVLPLNCRAGS
ncbi:pilin [Aquabacterium humicola]|uniref:pilin n=1 Tax=Aquabacterium humicola TaxID=3237377 RepID=UPI0025429459|nr:pilin [Rubrivivax pictus]